MDVLNRLEKLGFRRRRRAIAGLPIAGAIGLGAGLMYLFDRDRGTRRRAILRDKAVHTLRRTAALCDKGARDLRYRARGLRAELVARPEMVSDELLTARVRSKLGRYTAHARALEVTARDGNVSIRGPILEDEVRDLIAGIAQVPGVMAIEDNLEIHRDAQGVPALQGRSRGARDGAARLREGWAPSTRLIIGAAAAGLAVYGLARRDKLGTVLGALGSIALVRDLSNRPLRRLLGVGTGPRAVELKKTITVRAPLDDVFDLWMNMESFPRFMSHLREVKKVGEGRYRWVATGPLGVPVSWDAEVTKLIPGKALAWESIDGATVKSAGSVHFEPNPDGSTRLDIRMSYTPPAGAVGHVIAAIFGVDPKRAMDEDLVRLQSILERGKTTAHGEEVHFAEVAGPS